MKSLSLGELAFVVVAIIALMPVLLAVIAVFMIFSAWIFKFGWNHGITGLVHAAGGDVSKISFTTAYGASWAMLTARGILSAVGGSHKSSSNVD